MKSRCRLCGKYVSGDYIVDHTQKSASCMAKLQNELRALVESHIDKYGIDSLKISFDGVRKLSANAE